MDAAAYQINPVLMGGTATVTGTGLIKINLFGRLGVLYVPETLIENSDDVETGTALEFYFSYIQIVDRELDYDYAPLKAQGEELPCLVGGTLTEVNDTAAKLDIGDGLGTVAVPRRWLFTNQELAEGQHAEFYMSRMHIQKN